MSTASRKRKQINRALKNFRDPNHKPKYRPFKGQMIHHVKKDQDHLELVGGGGFVGRSIFISVPSIYKAIEERKKWLIEEGIALPSELIKPTEKFWGDLSDEQLEADKMDTWREEIKLRFLKEKGEN